MCYSASCPFAKNKMLRFLLFSLTVLCFVSQGFAEVPAYQVIKEKSSLRFFAIQNNASIEGKFTEFSASIQFAQDRPEDSSIVVEIFTASVETSYDEVMNNVKLPEWLSVEAFPKAKFISKKIVRMPMTNNYYAEGELTVRDKTAPVTLNFQLDQPEENIAIAKGSATLHRRNFGVGQGQWASDDVVKDEVRIEFRIVARKQ